MGVNPNRFYKLSHELAKMEFILNPSKINIHISFIVWGKSYVYGFNNEKSHPDIYYNYAPFKIMLHSERAAFIRCQNISSKSKILINFRWSRSSNIPLMSRPCRNCLMWCCKEFEHIYYSNNNGAIERLY